MVTAGMYAMRATTTNAPSTGSYWSLIVNKSDTGNYVQQIAIKESTYEMYIRYLSGGSTWSAWQRMATINDIIAGGGAKITVSATAPSSPGAGDFWYQVI